MAPRFTRRRLLIGAAGAAGFGAVGYKLLRGFEDEPDEGPAETLPPQLRRAALDIHVHVLGSGAGGTGCWMSGEMRRGIVAYAGFWSLGLTPDQPDLDQRYVAYLLSRLRSAGFLKQAVLLAMDCFYTPSGERDLARTPFFVPNDYVARLAARHAEFLFGASVHPYRKDAREELERVAASGAVLVKWIPNIHAIDLAEARCRTFYRRMAALGLPLLVHTGDERAAFVAGQEFGDPRRLVRPLEEGVTVIAAHVASLGERDGKPNFDHLAELLPKWPNLYADTSALTLVSRWRALLRLAERHDLHSKLVHGSDFPLPPATTMFLGRVPFRTWWAAWKRENPFRRDFEIKRALGLPDEIFLRGYDVLRPRQASAM